MGLRGFNDYVSKETMLAPGSRTLWSDVLVAQVILNLEQMSLPRMFHVFAGEILHACYIGSLLALLAKLRSVKIEVRKNDNNAGRP